MRVLLPGLWLCFAAFAQTAEVRGTVTEQGSNTPVSGAEVALREFGPNADNLIVDKVVVSTITGPDGTFVLRPGHFGSFNVEAKQQGFIGTLRSQAPLTAAAPTRSVLLTLARSGTITGRVIDEQGNPAANLRVMVERSLAGLGEVVYAPGSLEIPSVTNAEGIFTAPGLTPGAYRVHLLPKPASDLDALTAFTEAAFKIVDQDIEPSYWPGGFPDPNMMLPITLAGGAIANAGTIMVRRVPYFRVRVTLNRDCDPNERWTVRMRPVGSRGPSMDRYAECHKDSLLTGVPPGAYELAVWTGRSVDRWAITPVIVTKENTTAAITFTESPSLSGHVKAADSADLAKLGQVNIVVRSAEQLPSSNGFTSPDETGNFKFDRVPWRSQWLSVEPAQPDTYVKEIRYSGLPLHSPKFDAIPGASLDIVVDSQAAQLTVTGGLVLLVSASLTELPSGLLPLPPFVMRGGPEPINNIPPGDYKLIAMPSPFDTSLSDPSALAQRFARAERITFGKGEHKTIDVKPK